jgi:hypothetical protein
MEPAEHTRPSTPLAGAVDQPALGAEAVRLARIAAALHMDQAARLRARMAAGDAARTTAAHDSAPAEISS